MTHRRPAFPRRHVLAAAWAALALPRPAPAQPTPAAAPTVIRIRLAFASQVFTATLHDNPTARDLAAMLPLDLTIDDYATNEKVAYLPRKLAEQGGGPFGNEAPGDIGYFAPWGNLAFYHGAYRWSAGLSRLGRLDGGIEPLLTRGKFPLRIESLA